MINNHINRQVLSKDQNGKNILLNVIINSYGEKKYFIGMEQLIHYKQALMDGTIIIVAENRNGKKFYIVDN